MKNPTLKLLDPDKITVPFAGVTPEVGVTSIFPNLASIREYWRLQATIQGEDLEATMREFYGPFLEHHETLEGASGFMPWRDQGTGVPYMDHFVLATVRKFGYGGMVGAALEVPNLPKEGDKFIARAFPDRWTALKQSPGVVRKRNGILHMFPPERVDQGSGPQLNLDWLAQSPGAFLGQGAVLPIEYVNLFTGALVDGDQFGSLYTAGAFLGVDRMILLRDQLHQYKERKEWADTEVTEEELARFAMVWSQHIFQGTPEKFAEMHNLAFRTDVHFERKEDGLYFDGQKVGEYVDPASVKRNAHTISRSLQESPYRDGENRQESLDRRLQPRAGLEYIFEGPSRARNLAVHFDESVVIDGIRLVRAGDILGAPLDVSYVDIPRIPTAKTAGERVRGVLKYFQIRAGFGDLIQIEEAERSYSARQTEIAVARGKIAETALRDLQQAHDELTRTYGKLEEALAEVAQLLYTQDHEVMGETRLAENALGRALRMVGDLTTAQMSLEQGIGDLITKTDDFPDKSIVDPILERLTSGYERLKAVLKAPEKSQGPSSIEEEIEAAQRRIRYMSGSLKSIKYYAKFDAGRLKTDGTTKDMADMLTEEVELHNADRTSQRKTLGPNFGMPPIALQITSEYDGSLYAPRDGLQMIMYNLVRNSCQLDTTGIDLTVSGTDGQVQVEYRDYTQSPMDEATARAWEQGKAKPNQDSHLGMGNKLTYRVLEACGASLHVQPETDGTRFIFTFKK